MGEMLTVRDAYRAQECNASGLTKREYCQQRGISEKSFYYWLRKLRTQMTGAVAPQLVQLEPVLTMEDTLQIQYRGADVIHADETVVQVLKEDGKVAASESRMWLYASAALLRHQVRLFE